MIKLIENSFYNCFVVVKSAEPEARMHTGHRTHKAHGFAKLGIFRRCRNFY